jgi:hypothetical protein
MAELDDNFNRVNEFGSILCEATRKDGTQCQGYCVVDINSGYYCQAHGWDLLKRKRQAAKDRARIRAEFAKIGQRNDPCALGYE